MILFTILMCVLLAIAAIVLVSALVAGAGFVVVFGDFIVCALLVALIVHLFTTKK